MKIKTLHINLYKSIKDPLQFEVMPVNILIGQNNCGKSNILYAVDYLFDVQGVSDILAYHKADIEAELEFSQAEQDQWSLPDKQASLSIKNGQRKLKELLTLVVIITLSILENLKSDLSVGLNEKKHILQ